MGQEDLWVWSTNERCGLEREIVESACEWPSKPQERVRAPKGRVRNNRRKETRRTLEAQAFQLWEGCIPFFKLINWCPVYRSSASSVLPWVWQPWVGFLDPQLEGHTLGGDSPSHSSLPHDSNWWPVGLPKHLFLASHRNWRACSFSVYHLLTLSALDCFSSLGLQKHVTWDFIKCLLKFFFFF